MKIENRVKKFKADLRSDANRPNDFNVNAFLFSSLYFLYIGMYKYFMVFAALPFIIIFILSQFFEAKLIILIGFLLAHITAALVANQRIREYKEKYVKLYENADTEQPVEYFAMSVIRLFFCTFFSFGLYSVYWGYRNWNIYQKTTRDHVYPRLLGILFNFTAILLFAKIRHTTKAKKSFFPQGIACLLIFILEILIAQAFIRNAVSGGWYIFLAVILIALMIAYTFCLISVQKSINKHNVEVLKKHLNRYFSTWELFILLIGLILNISVWFGNSLIRNNTFTAEQAAKVSDAVSFIYRHTDGYASVCRKEGYVLRKYPHIFNNIFAPEIRELKRELAKRGYTLEEAKQELITSQIDDIRNSIYNELDQLRKIWIMYAYSEEQGIPIRTLDWRDSFDDLMDMKDACSIFDTEGINILQNSETKNYLKSRAL